MDEFKLNQILEDSLSDTGNVFTGHVSDKEKYIDDAIHGIRESKCKPFIAKAKVMEPGFDGKNLGDTIEGYCVAENKGYWLIYHPENKCFYCFWGTDIDHLGAHGVIGGALDCWLA